jgi:hypothetical protein
MAVAREPWNDWYHCMGNTYGTWLPGDPKGFRTRHHREHVDGDYRNPPPKGRYDERHLRSKGLMKRPPVYLSPGQRVRAVDQFVRSLQKRDIEVVTASVDRVHFHVLARFADRRPRHWIGVAKKESSHYLKQDGLAPVGGLWATRFECIPIDGRGHQLRTVAYILKHAKKGGVVRLIKRSPAS